MSIPTTGEELRSDRCNWLALEGLRVRALGVLDSYVPVFDQTQKPLKVAVAQQVGRLELPADD